MKKRFLSFIFAICFIIPCVFALAGCGQGKGIKLEGKAITFDSFEDLVWEEECLYVYKWYGDVKYEANLTLEEFVKNYWDSEAFARGVGSASGFNSLGRRFILFLKYENTRRMIAFEIEFPCKFL